MRGDLGARLYDGTTDRLITRKVSGLRFRKTAPGGHADASCKVNLPVTEFPDLGPADRLYISDARTARVVFDGYTNNPGTTTGRDGDGFDVNALGGQSRLADKAQRFVYVDRALTSWTQDTVRGQAPSGTAQTSTGPDGSGALQGKPVLYLQFNPGQPVGTDGEVGLTYTGLAGADMKIGGLALDWDAGVTDSGWLMAWHTWPAPSHLVQTGFDSGGFSFAVFAGSASLDAGQSMIAFRAIRAGLATNVSTDIVWAASGNVSVLGQLVDRFGADLDMSTTAHIYLTNTWILACEVVEDLLGRALTFCDPATATIEATSYAIDQLAYVDGVKPAQVFEDLLLFEPDMLWEILETNPQGRHRFNYRAWPTEPRYVIPSSIPVTRPGGDVDLCNRIAVSWSWTDKDGNHPEVEIVTSIVPELDRVSRVRDADPVTLPAGRGSAANAQRLGEQILAAKATPPKAGTCVVDRPIMDLYTGTMAMPWELEPGYLAQAMATGEVLRVTEMEYTDDSCSTTLTLGEPMPTPEQRIARLERTQ